MGHREMGVAQGEKKMSDSILLSKEGSIKEEEEERFAPLCLTAPKICTDLKRPTGTQRQGGYIKCFTTFKRATEEE